MLPSNMTKKLLKDQFAHLIKEVCVVAGGNKAVSGDLLQ